MDIIYLEFLAPLNANGEEGSLGDESSCVAVLNCAVY